MTFLRVIVFSVLVLLVYTGFANILPQVQSDPPSEEVLDTGGLDMAGMIAYGETLFSGQGTCTLCHKAQGRAPDLLGMDLAAAFEEAINDPVYAGVAAGQSGAGAVEAYLRESLTDPSAYVVAGFSKKGTQGKVSPMPAVDAPPIEMNEVQMHALIAFLQERAGFEPTVPLPGAGDVPAAEETGEEEGEPLALTGDEAIEKYFCAACHALQGSEADLGPPLNGLALRLSRGEIMEAILEPNSVIAEGYDADIMPTDFGEQMHSSELILIVDYLSELPE
jgi:mono/diheme cytochrome c family protein